MHEQLRPTSLPAATQAAEGLARRRWSVAEIEAMVAQGILLEDERFELIGGEAVPMAPKGHRHEVVKAALQQYWFPRIVDSPIDLITETTLRVGQDEFYGPDFLFWPRSIPLKDVTAANALLIVEVADTSLRYDLGTKAARPTHRSKQDANRLWRQWDHLSCCGAAGAQARHLIEQPMLGSCSLGPWPVSATSCMAS
jgi:hypothetical protein